MKLGFTQTTFWDDNYTFFLLMIDFFTSNREALAAMGNGVDPFPTSMVHHTLMVYQFLMPIIAAKNFKTQCHVLQGNKLCTHSRST